MPWYSVYTCVAEVDLKHAMCCLSALIKYLEVSICMYVRIRMIVYVYFLVDK